MWFEAGLFPSCQLQGLTVALNYTTAFCDQEFIVLRLGIFTHAGGAFGRQGRGCAIQNDFRLRALCVGAGSQINCSGIDANCNIRLLMRVGGVLFDNDKGVLFYRVVRAVIEDDLGHAFRSGLNDVTFFKRKAVVGAHPLVAIGFFNPDRPIESCNMRLLRDYSPRGRRLRGYPLQQIREKTADGFLRSCAELGESKPCCDQERHQNSHDKENHASVGDGLPGNLYPWLLAGVHEYPLWDRTVPLDLRQDYYRLVGRVTAIDRL